MQLEGTENRLKTIREPKVLLETLRLYTGMTREQIYEDIRKKMSILKWMVDSNFNDVHRIGLLMSRYYTNKAFKDLVA